MKYIIILLTSLFLVSNAMAEDRYKSIKDVCKNIESIIIGIANYDARNSQDFNEKKITADEWKKAIEIVDAGKKEYKNYHYLDCSDFR